MGQHLNFEGKGQALWNKAKELIPGGNMLLSKRAEMFLPGKWPAYFSRASGCNVWDLDNRKFTDMSIMGIGTNSLGYGHPDVDRAVQDTVAKGNMSTLSKTKAHLPTFPRLQSVTGFPVNSSWATFRTLLILCCNSRN